MTHPYESLTPDVILDAVESTGHLPDGHLLALNSYENRVFQVGIDGAPPLIAKFYRPERWSDAAIAEELAFALTLAAAEIPVVPPYQAADGRTLFTHAGFRFALSPRRGGRSPEPGDLDQLARIGRFLGRIHMTGQDRGFRHRPTLSVDDMGWPARENVLSSPLLPGHLGDSYASTSEALLRAIDERLEEVGPRAIRLHGDCHLGNILWTDEGPHFVDLDDCRNGPAIQDLWMLISGSRDEQALQLDALLSGYTMFQPFDARQLNLIEPLRSLRMIHYGGWLAHRWPDPAFPAAFPWVASPHYWEQHVADLRHQLTRLDELPLPVCW
jgi:Ser/Thr protein kinase RdoA (MazF antagonist)